MDKWIETNKNLLILIGIVVFIIVVSATTTQLPVTGTDWQVSFKEKTENMSEYTKSTSIYDYNDKEIKKLSDRLVKESSNAREYTEKVIEFVYYNVIYDWNENDMTCFNSKASDVLERKSGQCDTQSLLVVALLRAGGVPAYSIGGCIHKSPNLACDVQYAVSGMRKPVFRPLDKLVLSRGGEEMTVSRGSNSRKGGLHAWVKAFTGERFQLIESTSGQIIETSCYVYTEELRADNIHDLCVSDDMQFAIWCSQQ